jgi:recombination DNA repair RAD52 pathway protein
MSQSITEQNQISRTERAQYALNHQQFKITLTDPNNWNVQNGDKRPYLVSKNLNEWACSCEDFIRNRTTGIRCKHIEAVRLSLTAGPSIAETSNFINFSHNGPHDIFSALDQPLDMSRVKRRKAPGGSVPYLEGYDVIEHANHIFNYQWSFCLLSEPSITRWKKQQTIYDSVSRKRVPLEINGELIMEDVGMVHITGKIIVIIENKTFEHADIGRCIFTGDTPEALDMAIAGCATDCLKRCFRQMGDQFGNSLYDKEIAKIAGTSQSLPTKIDQRLYLNGDRVNGNVSEQEAFDNFLKAHHGTSPATREALRSWSTKTDKHNEQKIVTEPAFATN